jgi:hypothetical protein
MPNFPPWSSSPLSNSLELYRRAFGGKLEACEWRREISDWEDDSSSHFRLHYFLEAFSGFQGSKIQHPTTLGGLGHPECIVAHLFRVLRATSSVPPVFNLHVLDSRCQAGSEGPLVDSLQFHKKTIAGVTPTAYRT